jgi:Zn-dependent M32 family carboxypeptidase
MPRGAVASRAEQVATLSRLSQEMLVNEAMARLLDSVGEPAPSSEEGAPVRRVRQNYANRAGARQDPRPLVTSTNPHSRLGAARDIDAKRPPYARR